MNIPPWYRPRRRFLAEAVLTIDLSRSTGIGPLVPGLSALWDMTPILCQSDPSYRVRLTADAGTLSVWHRAMLVSQLTLRPDRSRMGSPLRAVCPGCGRNVWRLYFVGGWFRCGRCLRVTYASGRAGENDRAHARIARLENRLHCTQWRPRYRGRRMIQAEIARQDRRLMATLPGPLLRRLVQALGDE